MKEWGPQIWIYCSSKSISWTLFGGQFQHTLVGSLDQTFPFKEGPNLPPQEDRYLTSSLQHCYVAHHGTGGFSTKRLPFRRPARITRGVHFGPTHLWKHHVWPLQKRRAKASDTDVQTAVVLACTSPPPLRQSSSLIATLQHVNSQPTGSGLCIRYHINWTKRFSLWRMSIISSKFRFFLKQNPILHTEQAGAQSEN